MIAAAAADTSTGGGGTDFADPITWINFGVLGLLVLGLLTGFIWGKPAVERLIADKERALAERDKAFEQRDAMATVLQDRLLPVVAEFITTTRAFLPVLQEIQRLQHVVPLLEQLARDKNADRSGGDGGDAHGRRR